MAKFLSTALKKAADGVETSSFIGTSIQTVNRYVRYRYYRNNVFFNGADASGKLTPPINGESDYKKWKESTRFILTRCLFGSSLILSRIQRPVIREL